jgi:hypothetical protein
MDIFPWRDAAGRHRIEEDGIMEKEPKLSEELKKMEYEPLLPVEKKLIGWSISLGLLLLGILVWISYTFFPGGH